jgi:o-succinylbenzoate synthase
MTSAARATPFAIPLRHPLRAGGASITARHGLLIERRDADGRLGLGEVVAPPTTTAPRWRAADLRRGLEAAGLDLAAQRRGCALATHLGGARRTHIAVNALLGGGAPAACAEQAAALVARGFRCLKLKLAADDLDGDVRRLAAIRAAVGSAIALRADANAAWSVESAISALGALTPFNLEYVEQPVAGVAEMAIVRRATAVPLAADESVVDAAAIDHLAAARAADVVVIKPAFLGLGESRRAADAARRAHLAVVVTSGLDTSIGIAAAAHLAATLDDPLPACGLATAEWLAGDLAQAPLHLDDGALMLPAACGLGLALDGAALERWRSGESFEIPLAADAQDGGY